MEPIVTLLVIGAGGGLVRAFLGYKTQSDEGEKFNVEKAAKSVIRAALLGTAAALGIATATGTEITTATYASALIVSVGMDVLAKEGVGTLRQK